GNPWEWSRDDGGARRFRSESVEMDLRKSTPPSRAGRGKGGAPLPIVPSRFALLLLISFRVSDSVQGHLIACLVVGDCLDELCSVAIRSAWGVFALQCSGREDLCWPESRAGARH